MAETVMAEMDALARLGEAGEAVQQKLWRLLSRQARDYTLGDSSSLPAEVAEELFRSILYTLRRDLTARGETLLLLEVQDEGELYARAVKRLERDIAQTKALYEAVNSYTPVLEHIALRDTLRNLGIGLARYDYHHFAHVPPGEIDYQLCLPVPDELLGIDYVREYLHRLMRESMALSRFDRGECIRFMQRRFPDYRELLINLFEPVMTCGLGRVLTGEPLLAPHIAFCDIARLPPRLTQKELQPAALALCDGLKLPEECKGYMIDCALALLPRYGVAAANGALSNLFGDPGGTPSA